jgi:DivIVA domain-containing protein
MRGRRKDRKSQKGSEEEALFNEQPQSEPRRITPVDIQQKEFRLAMRGYHERDVDEFLDEITEEVARLYAENKRLGEELETKGTHLGGTGLGGEADAVIRQAHDEAARIVAEAESRARALAVAGRSGGAGGPPVTGAALAGFLSREKSFLQNLAKMMQDHANAMKEDVRRVRDSAKGADIRSAPSFPAGDMAPQEEDMSSGGLPPLAPSRERAERPEDPWRPPRADSSASSSWSPARPEPTSPEEPPSPLEASQPGQPPYFMNEPPPWAEDAAARPDDPRRGGEAFAGDRPGSFESPDRGPAATDLLPADTMEGGEVRRPEAPSYLDEPTREWTLGEGGLDERDADEFTTRRTDPDPIRPSGEVPADEAPISEAPDPMHAAADQAFGPAQDGANRRDPANPRWRGDGPPPPRRDPMLEDEAPGDERSLKELFWGED